MNNRKGIYDLLYWALIEIRLETATEDGNIAPGYTRIWQLSHLMHNIPSKLFRAEAVDDYVKILDDITESFSALNLRNWLDEILTSNGTGGQKEALHILLNQAFGDVRVDAELTTNKKIVAICQLLHGVSLRLASAETDSDYQHIIDDIRKKSESIKIARWVEKVFSYETTEG